MSSETPTPPVTTNVPVVLDEDGVLVVSESAPALMYASVPLNVSEVLVALYRNE